MMKPLSIAATVMCFACLCLSIAVFVIGLGNHDLQKQLVKQQGEFQAYEQAVQLRQQEFQRQQQIIEAGAAVAQKHGKAILTDVGVRAVKNKNQGLRDLLVRYQKESFIPTAEDLQRYEEAIARNAVNGPAPKPAAETNSKPATESSSKPAAESSSKPAVESRSKPATENGSKPAAPR